MASPYRFAPGVSVTVFAPSVPERTMLDEGKSVVLEEVMVISRSA